MISTNLRIVAIAGSLGLLVFVIELVRRHRIKEEYSVLWVATAIVLLLLAAWGGLLQSLAHAIGANSQASTLYFFGLLFAMFLLLHFSVRVSQLEKRVTTLIQEMALLGGRGRPAREDAESAAEDAESAAEDAEPAHEGLKAASEDAEPAREGVKALVNEPRSAERAPQA